MFADKRLRLWHLGQVVIQLIVLLVYSLLTLPNINKRGLWSLLICFVFCLLEFTLVKSESEQATRWQKINHYLEVLAITYTLPESLRLISKLILRFNFLNPTFWMIIVGIYTLVMYIPMAKLALAKVQNNWGRIILLALIIFNNTVGAAQIAAADLGYTAALEAAYDSGFAGCFALIIITLLAMHEWGFHAPHFKFGSKVSVGIIFLIICLLVLNIFYQIFPRILANPTWDYLYSTWQTYSFNLEFNLNLKMIFTVLEAGIAEEWLMRYCVLNLLLKIFQNNKWQLVLAVFFDGLIFGMWHLSNISFQSLPATLYQMFGVGSSALFLAAIYLYTDSLLVGMIYHCLYDFPVFLFQGAADVGN
ncbi:CPBP family glutamic-type intramembrane protease [Lactobacillus sp. ESL0791]|uniref:CPBP family intramembrane glutamic endopeptidase n=1 Tax=Lactobacillus sp. ESL0791 TaxID=2983234 RepID=UPI0023F7D796|nr:CPBP family glutamic-type intramembrane protease [Lactobacillus sp. ESL0791]MDF7637981.1 CPBP family glutamic-type intramembrane protease [Lactobacillus sp. ESL0791]